MKKLAKSSEENGIVLRKNFFRVTITFSSKTNKKKRKGENAS